MDRAPEAAAGQTTDRPGRSDWMFPAERDRHVPESHRHPRPHHGTWHEDRPATAGRSPQESERLIGRGTDPDRDDWPPATSDARGSDKFAAGDEQGPARTA